VAVQKAGAPGAQGWALQVHSIKTRVETAYGFISWRAVHVYSIKTRVESAYGFSA
jgi:hypothetical protein